MSGGIIFYGDPHGEWRPLLRACREERPEAVVLLGDCDLAAPLRQQLAPIVDAGIRLRWIHGNHDTDVPEWYDRLWGDYPEGGLHGRCIRLGGLEVAGLGGVFHSDIWEPRSWPAAALHASRRDYLKQLSRSDYWRGGLSLRRRSAIFPEDVEALRDLRADVLATHEAPSAHRHGFAGIDMAAAACCARMIVHGHHHQSYAATLPDGTRVRGLAKAEVLRLRPEDVA